MICRRECNCGLAVLGVASALQIHCTYSCHAYCTATCGGAYYFMCGLHEVHKSTTALCSSLGSLGQIVNGKKTTWDKGNCTCSVYLSKVLCKLFPYLKWFFAIYYLPQSTKWAAGSTKWAAKSSTLSRKTFCLTKNTIHGTTGRILYMVSRVVSKLLIINPTAGGILSSDVLKSSSDVLHSMSDRYKAEHRRLEPLEVTNWISSKLLIQILF